VAATIGLVQNDVKRVLAYSTVSQLGYMFLATGVGAFAAGIFHLMTHAFFKALLFLGSGSVIHAMAGEQDMRRMGALRQFMPVTFVTMLIGTLAIAGIPPFSGFFSKDEILLRTFLSHRGMWAIAAITALMTAFYMFRLMSLTFYGAYRGPAWEAHGHGQGGHDDHAHRAWHGPHESPRIMTVPLMALAVGALVAGFVGVPHALGGNNAVERFLEPSFVASAAGMPEAGAAPAEGGALAAHAAADDEGVAPVSTVGEIGLMMLSVVLAVGGIWFAYRIFVVRPEVSEALAVRWAGPHRVLTNKYYVDELYGATVVRGTLGSARGSWAFDRLVIDGAVDGSGWLTRLSAWISHMIDKYAVDGLVNLAGWATGEGSYVLRRIQTGLIQNYALVMLMGVFAILTLYLFTR
jgi:NADH-quinone oxidoreductase subunit L